ncbi:hypothetical protein FJY70_03740 [candidate division WOR-3 bacterium]|nr:hypothetical protein [candidate division WOR-3 bacterium]
MKIDDLDWMDWLHKIRRESEAERKRLGLSGEEWLRRKDERAAEVRREIASLAAPAVRDASRPGD